MRQRASNLALGIAVLLFTVAPAPADVPDGEVKLVSAAEGDTNGRTGSSGDAAVSFDGRYVAFRSAAWDLISNDGNGRPDVFVKDMVTGEIEAVSSFYPDSTMANGESFEPAISGNGRFIAFNSYASNLPGGNGDCQTFLLDRGDLSLPKNLRLRRLVLVSAVNKSLHAGNDGCGSWGGPPSVSDDGRYVGFISRSNNLIWDDQNGGYPWTNQPFIRDVWNETTQRLLDAHGEQTSANDGSWQVKVSGDGEYAVFASSATNIPLANTDGRVDLFLWARKSPNDRSEVVAKIDMNRTNQTGDRMYDFSRDGRWVAFETTRSFSPDDTDGLSDIYLAYGFGVLPDPLPNPNGGNPTRPVISADGRFVAFYSPNYPEPDNVFVYDHEEKSTWWTVTRLDGEWPITAASVAISGDGRTVAFNSRDANLVPQESGEPWTEVFALGDTMDLLDPSPVLHSSLSWADLLANPIWLASDQLRKVQGMAADGVTRTIVRFFPALEPTGEVTVRLFDESWNSTTDIGALSPLDQSVSATEVSVPSELLNNERMVLVTWRAPEHFARPQSQDSSAVERAVIVEISYDTEVGPIVHSRKFKLVRPPVALIHGLWSSSDEWEWGLLEDDRYAVWVHDYQEFNDASFRVNYFVPYEAAQNALKHGRSSMGVAATQVDVVGHSMGGVLERLVLARDPFESSAWGSYRNDNFHEGDVHRLITMGSPHLGTDAACLLLEILSKPGVGQVFSKLLEALGRCADCGAVRDLQTGSAELGQVDATPSVPVHALVGTGGRDFLNESHQLLNATTPITLFWHIDAYLKLIRSSYDELFWPSPDHDLLVGSLSAEGGLTGDHVDAFGFAPPEYGHHLEMIKKSRFEDAVIDLLETPPSEEAIFAPGFPATTSVGCGSEPQPQSFIHKTAGPIYGGIHFTSPDPYATARPGDVIELAVEPADGRVLDRVLLSTGFDAAFVDAAPFSASFTVPGDVLGSFTVSALAYDTQEVLLVAEERLLQVRAPETLVELSVLPDPVRLGSGNATAQLEVTGLYDSGVERDLTSALLGTAYGAAEESVATVSLGGLVTARGPGVTPIEVTHGAVSARTAVLVARVGPYLHRPSPQAAGGVNAFRVSGADPGATLELFRGSGAGSTPAGSCEVGLDQATPLGGGQADGSGDASIEAAIPAADAGSVVHFQVLDAASCAASEVVPAYFGEPGGPPSIVDQPLAAVTAEEGSAVTLAVRAVGDGPLAYRWQKGTASPVDLVDGLEVSGAATATLRLYSVSPDDADAYRCVVTNAFGEAVSDPAQVEVVTPVPGDRPGILVDYGEDAVHIVQENPSWELYNNGTPWKGKALAIVDSGDQLTLRTRPELLGSDHKLVLGVLNDRWNGYSVSLGSWTSATHYNSQHYSPLYHEEIEITIPGQQVTDEAFTVTLNLGANNPTYGKYVSSYQLYGGTDDQDFQRGVTYYWAGTGWTWYGDEWNRKRLVRLTTPDGSATIPMSTSSPADAHVFYLTVLDDRASAFQIQVGSWTSDVVTAPQDGGSPFVELAVDIPAGTIPSADFEVTVIDRCTTTPYLYTTEARLAREGRGSALVDYEDDAYHIAQDTDWILYDSWPWNGKTLAYTDGGATLRLHTRPEHVGKDHRLTVGVLNDRWGGWSLSVGGWTSPERYNSQHDSPVYHEDLSFVIPGHAITSTEIDVTFTPASGNTYQRNYIARYRLVANSGDQDQVRGITYSWADGWSLYGWIWNRKRLVSIAQGTYRPISLYSADPSADHVFYLTVLDDRASAIHVRIGNWTSAAVATPQDGGSPFQELAIEIPAGAIPAPEFLLTVFNDSDGIDLYTTEARLVRLP